MKIGTCFYLHLDLGKPDISDTAPISLCLWLNLVLVMVAALIL
jgi:hypothetical protein